MTVQTENQCGAAAEAHDRLIARLRTLKGLPTTVAVAVRLFQLQKETRDAQPGDYARIIATDAGMTARILALANSSYFGLSVRITQPTVAVNLLGVAAVRTLAINFCLSGLHHELKLTRPEAKQFWEASLCKAVAARHLARHLDEVYADDAYVAGLFQDMALPVMFATSREVMEPLLEARLSVPFRLEGERAVFSSDHAVLGEVFARTLGLSPSQARMIGAHHDRATLMTAAGTPALGAAAYAAALFPHRLDQWDAGDVETLRTFLASAEGGRLKLETFLQEVSAECTREFAYFDKAKVTEIGLVELMSHAMSQAAQSAEEMVGQLQQLKNQVAHADEVMQRSQEDRQRLTLEATRDLLTGVLNRAGFERQARAALEVASEQRQALGMIFIDLDRFKRINDLHGHDAGDRALKQVAEVLRECTRQSDILGRVGGDEFAVVLPNCPREKSIEIGQRIRTRVAACPNPHQTLSVSVGIRWTPLPGDLSLEALIRASDQRMYAAKRAGGNGLSVEVG